MVDFDMVGPTSRLTDVYNTAMHWVPLRDPTDLWSSWVGVDQASRLRVLADAYGLTEPERAAIVDVGIARANRTWLLMKGAAELGPHVGRGSRRPHSPPPSLAGHLPRPAHVALTR